MIKLLLLIAVIYGVFWLTSPPGEAFLASTTATLQQKGVRGVVEPVWCGERGCEPDHPSRNEASTSKK